jgi:MFS family permease
VKENASEPSLLTALTPVLALLFGFALLQMGNTLQGTLLSVRGGLESFSPSEIGFVGAGFWAGLILGSLYADGLIRAVGHTRTFAALASLASAAPLLHLMAVDPILWVLVRMLTGFCFAGLFMVVESWLNGTASSAIRGQILSIYGMTGLIAGVSGQLLLPVADASGFMLFCIVSVTISIALVPVALSRAAAPASSSGEAGLSLPRLYRQSPFGLVAAFLCGFSTGSFFALGPLFAQRLGFAEGGIALFMASASLGGFAMTWPLGWLSDRRDRRSLIVTIAIVAAAIMTAMLTLVPSDLPEGAMHVLAFIFGGVVIPTLSLVIAHVNDKVEPGEFVAASAGLLIVQGAGAVAGPILAGFAMSVFGGRGLPGVTIIAQIAIALWGLHRMRQLAAPQEKEGFQVMAPEALGTELVAVSQEAEGQRTP